MNHAGGIAATVPGGMDNWADGDYSYAAGKGARAVHEGAFVSSDNSILQTTSPAASTFSVRAAGGIWFGAAG